MGWEGSGIRVRPAVGRRLLDTLTLRDRETHAVEEMMCLAASGTARGFYGPGKPACSRDPAVRTADHFGLYSPQQRKCCHSLPGCLTHTGQALGTIKAAGYKADLWVSVKAAELKLVQGGLQGKKAASFKHSNDADMQ
ncbi:hypothetical protein E2I00_007465 [Balaenoptera physalus]|uniref:Uncharacterized protein n=1 Tax=Balaenoptera physalus TaxID=9770 RepID=A0A6A1QDZ6_BALPH|nr:hypothetical protein E2I00_007465 [Balaenoptera physalus]